MWIGFLSNITINLSFSTTIEESLRIGDRSAKPWDASLSIPYRLPPLRALRALDQEALCTDLPQMAWLPLLPPTPVPLALWFIPQFTAATAEEGAQQPVGLRSDAIGDTTLFLLQNNHTTTANERLSEALQDLRE